MEKSGAKERILITGINGLVGSFLARIFLTHHYRIKAIKRKNSDLSLIHDIKDKIEWHEADILDTDALEPAFNNTDMVIHCAAMVSFSKKNKKKLFEINVQGTANIVNMCLSRHVKKLCYISSIAALGKPVDHDKYIDEHTPAKKETTKKNNYAISKHLAELEIWRGKQEGLQVFVFNPSVVLGPGIPGKSSTQIFDFIKKGIRFYPTGSTNVVDVRDLARLVYLAYENNLCNQNFIINACLVSYKTLFQKTACCFKQQLPDKKLSPWMLTLIYWFMQPLNFFNKQGSPVTKEILHLSTQAPFYDNSKLTKALHYNYHNLDDTLSWTCQNIMNGKL